MQDSARTLEDLRRIRKELVSCIRESIVDHSYSRYPCCTAHALIAPLARYLERNLQAHFSLSDVAYILGMERTHCSRVFRSMTGKSFRHWYRDIRLRIAKNLLCQTDASISAISLAVGYSDITTFGRNFRKSEGLSPTQFRQDHKHSGQGQ